MAIDWQPLTPVAPMQGRPMARVVGDRVELAGNLRGRFRVATPLLTLPEGMRPTGLQRTLFTCNVGAHNPYGVAQFYIHPDGNVYLATYPEYIGPHDEETVLLRDSFSTTAPM
ncbi:hypothetical protein [Streptomyces sp. NPDC046261]|uniref:hypothetical protein n=1 Tax=Streptomyces sp. NPDC046261 TaxID=3157200 RepID=UPI0033F40815